MSSRRFYTADEQGLIKVVTVTELPPVKAKRYNRTRDTPESPKKPEATIETWGTPDRERAIQLMCWDNQKKHLVVARKNGSVQLIDPKDGSVTLEFKQTLVKVEKIETAFVGLFANSESIITCTNTGVVSIHSIKDASATPTTFNVGKDICRMRVHPRDHHIIATGGKEQELTIWDLNALTSEVSKEDAKKPRTGKSAKGKSPSSITPQNNSKDSSSSNGSARYKSKEILDKGQIFKAKNVKNDNLDLRVPVWNVDFQFLSTYDHTRIAVGTRNHQIRVYDTKTARRPAVDAEVGTMPVIALATGKDASEIVFSDTVTNVYSVDTLTGSIIGQYKGFTGVTTALATFLPFEDSDATHLVTVSMDRFMRIHEMDKTRKLLHKVYLKQRLTAVVVGEFTPYEGSNEDDEEDGADRVKRGNNNGGDDGMNDDDIWNSMGKLGPKSKKRKVSKE
ncbi:WD repeat-containing protein 74 [Lunasporangiospora selenospora]|uniref:Ribosome biogenesis protein NSA1 n=1 Tax=Lunasporangiospora selenospora TaxID=979761 RepID=A0A9P6G351_9FUNG|nr:WD repeat-containing protein 74 [Lunasporangiospora selenospora]